MISTNYIQVVPGSHRYTLYGLEQELKRLMNLLIIQEQSQGAIDIVEDILKGIENSIAAGTDKTTLI